MALEIILNLVPTVLEYTVGPLIRHAGYAFCYARKVAELKNQVEKLAATRESLQNSVHAANRRGDEIQPTVEKWLNDSENKIKEAGELTQRGEEEAKKKCFAGGCPNLKTRHQLGRKATKEALAIQALENEGKFDPSQISYRAPLQQIISSSAHGFEGLPSRASIFKDVMDALSDPNIYLIGVYGLGGTGKTTLAREVHKQAIEGNLFDVVAMATVSQKPDLKEIQGSIADFLGLIFEEETVDGRASRLHHRLMKEKKVLIILDNLWEKIDLEKLGIPVANEQWASSMRTDSMPEVEQRKNYQKVCKLLITSRNRDLLTSDMAVQRGFMLDVLPTEESWTLFERMVGGLKIPELQSVAMEVAEKCAGFPLLLVTVASALKNKELEIWKDALYRLSTSKGQEVYSGLKLSYDHLPDEEAKSIFLLCGLFTYSNISIMDLLTYSMGLGLLKHIHTMEDARIRVHKLIGDLKASCLLSESEMDGRVKIHDVVQDVAASIATRTQRLFKKVGASFEELQRMDTTSCTKIYLENCDVSMLSLKSQCPAVEFFHLNAKDLSLKIPDSFFEGITKLQVLDFTGMRFSSLPLSLGSLSSLHSLCLDSCTLHDISVIMQLKNLEILSLWGSEIVELPRDLAQLTQLKLLDLSNCSKLKFIPENVLSQLSKLEELLMGDSFVNWGVERLNNQSNASLSELEHLSLTNLEIHVPDAKKLPKRLSSKKLERYKILIGDVWDWGGKYQASRTIKLKLDTSIHSKHGLKTLLKDAEDLYLDEVKGITNVLYDLHSEGFPQLKHLYVQNNGEIRYIIDSKRWVSCDAFPGLESLTLHNLVNLDKIALGKLLVGDFCRLRILKVRSCNKLKNLFPFSIVRRNLQQLGEMEIMDCSAMEVLFDYENEQAEEEEDDKNEVVEFTQLFSLKLRLPLLRSFCSKEQLAPASANASSSRQKQSAMDPPATEIESASDTSMPLFNEMIIFSNLKELKLSFIGVDKIWHEQFTDWHSFYKLTSLTVETCKNLNYLFISSMVKGLAQLQRLEICDCESLEDVIAIKGEEIDNIPFPNLEFLKLKGLPILSRFCIGGLIEFPSLKELWIEDCFQLKAFISNLIAGNTGSNLALFDEKASFPKLEELQIVNMDGIQMIWHNELHESSFCKLKTMIVKGAGELQNIFPSNMLLSRLLNLENLELNDCALLEEVFNLQLQALISFRTQGMAYSRLKTLRIQNLSNLKHIWNKHPQERELICFKDLQVVSVCECPNLKRVFPAFIARGLLQLDSLVLSLCGIEEIVERDKETEAIVRFEFPKLTTIILYNLRKLKTLYSGMHISEWPMLKKLDVHDCGEMEIFTSESESVQKNSWGKQPENSFHQPFFSVEKVIPNLEELTLNSKDVQMIHDSEFLADLFDNVRFLHLQLLDKKSASSLFAFLRRFCSLQKLEVENNGLQELFSCEELIDEVENRVGRMVTRIQHLRLHFLDNLKSIWKQDCQLEHMFVDLETLEVWWCKSLISLAPSVASFGNLSHLDVWKCEGLLNLVTSSTAKYMGHLNKLSIRECDMVEEIVAREEDDREDHVTWGNLKSLELRWLGSLTCFSSANHTFQFPFLEEVIVTSCPKMKTFSGGLSITPKLRQVKFAKEKDAKGRWEGDLNSTVQQLCAEVFELHGIEHIKLSDFSELKETWHKEHFPANFLSDLRSLVVDECVNILSSAVPSNLLRSLYNLAELEVKNCDSLEEVFDLTLSNATDGQIGTLPKLNKLQLIDLPRLKQLWKEESNGVLHLRNLKVLKIHNCSTLRYLFTQTMCLGLVWLQELEVKGCPVIQEIITKEASSGVDKVLLPRLNSVSLQCLPNLTGFYSGGVTVERPSLKSIVITACSSTFTFTFLNECPLFDANEATCAKIVYPNLKDLKLSSIRVDKIWHDHFADQPSFYTLTSFIVEACQNLNYLFTSSMVKSFAQLQKLEISNCDSMEDVIATEGEFMSRAPFPNLKFLKLKNLSVLRTFCISDLIEFPYLKELWIENCVELKAFISNPVTVSEGSNLALFDKKVAVPKLEKLQIVNMDGLKSIWHSELHECSFAKIKSIIVEHAEKLLNIFPFEMLMSRFLNLESLELIDCALLKEVFSLPLESLVNIRTRGPAASRLRTLRIRNLPNLEHIWNKHPQQREVISFNDLQVVDASECPNLKSVFPAFIARGLLQLERLELQHCGVEEIIQTDEETEANARFQFPKLTTLSLFHLEQLKRLYTGMHTCECPNLKILEVSECGSIKFFTSEGGSFQENSLGSQFNNFLQRSFFSAEKVIPNLEFLTLSGRDAQLIRYAKFQALLSDELRHLRLENLDEKSASFLPALLPRCRNLEILDVVYNELQEVFFCEGPVTVSKEGHQGRTVSTIRVMNLVFLWNLKTIWKQSCLQEQILFKDLELLRVFCCTSLISLAPSVASFGNLSNLDVRKCDALLNLVTSSTAQYLRRLTTLTISECDMVEEIVAREEEDQMMITWANLETLKLDRLASLTCFSSAHHTFQFPSLKEVIVTQCPKMKTFSILAPITPRLKLVKLTEKEEEGDDKGRWKGDLNTTIGLLHHGTVAE